MLIEEDRSLDAWETMQDIIELFDDDSLNDFDRFDKIKKLLERDYWI